MGVYSRQARHQKVDGPGDGGVAAEAVSAEVRMVMTGGWWMGQASCMHGLSKLVVGAVLEAVVSGLV